MKTSKIFISLLSIGSAGVVGTGSYFAAKKFSKESFKLSGKLSFSKQEVTDDGKKQEIYSGALLIDEKYKPEINQECKFENSTIGCNFLSSFGKEEIQKFLEKIGKF